jgi:hypothetical protein
MLLVIGVGLGLPLTLAATKAHQASTLRLERD